MGHDALVTGLFAIATIVVFILICSLGGNSRVAQEKPVEERKKATTCAGCISQAQFDRVVADSRALADNRPLDSYSDVAYERPEVFAERYYQRHRDRDRDDYYQPGIDGDRIKSITIDEASKAFYEYNWLSDFGDDRDQEPEQVYDQDQEINILTSPNTIGHCKAHPEDCPRYRG